MTIAVNTRFLLHERMEGIGRFSYEILKELTRRHREHTFIFLFDRKFNEQFIFSDNVKPVVLFPPARHPLLWYLYFERALPMALKKHKADLFVSMDGWLSLNTDIKSLQVLHDLHYIKHPEFLPFWVKTYYQFYFPRFVKKSDRIVTVSEYCREEIVSVYPEARNKIDIVYNSTREDYLPVSDDEKKVTKKIFSEGCDYFLIIGPIHPRKNIENSIRSFANLKRLNNSPLKLLITGTYMWRNFGALNKKLLEELRGDLVFTGYLEPDDLKRVTAAANCLVYVSFYEGFGMPVLEAMSSGVPVITSSTSAMPEVAGNAALFANPHSVDSITQAMTIILKDKKIAETLKEKGYLNVQRFSWKTSADKMWESILKMTV